MQRDHEELKRLRVEVQRLEAECRQGKMLNKNLTQIKGEKGILEDKVMYFIGTVDFVSMWINIACKFPHWRHVCILQVAQLERAQSRLQDNLTLHTENSRTEEDLRESRAQVAELKSVVEKLRTELTQLEKEHNRLR